MPPEQIAQSPTVDATTPPPAAPKASRPSRDPSVRSTLLSGLDKLGAESNIDDGAAADPDAGKPAAEPEAKPEPEKEAEAEPDDEEPEPEPEPAAEPEQKAAPDPKADPEAAKRLALIQKQEKRAREALAKERAELEAERAKIAAEKSALERFEAIKKRAKHDPAAALAALGLGDDDYELAARQIYARSKAAAADPKTREAADRALREREHGESLEQLRAQLDEVRNELKTRDERAVQQREAERYIASVSKAIGDDAPLVASVYAKNPEKARYEFGRVTMALYEQTGEMPEPAEVIAAYERQRRAELEELGIDPATVGKPKAAPAAKPSRTLGDTRSVTPTAANTPRTYKDKKRDLLRAMEADKIE